MTLVDTKPGGWALNEVLTSAQMNALKAELLKAIDGQDGGTYSLTAPLIIDGDEFHVGDILRVLASGQLIITAGASFAIQAATTGTFGAVMDMLATAVINIGSGAAVRAESGGFVIVESGGELTLQSGGEVVVNSGGIVRLESGASATVESGGAVDVESGGAVNLQSGSFVAGSNGAEVRVFAQEDHVITGNSPRSFVFNPLKVDISQVGGAGWGHVGPATGVSVIDQLITGGQFHVPLDVSPGDILQGLIFRVNGGAVLHGGSFGSLVLPSVTLYETDEDGVTTNLGTGTDTSANFAEYEVDHDIIAAGVPRTVAAGSRLTAIFSGESGASFVAQALRVLSIRGSIIRNRMRQSVEAL